MSTNTKENTAFVSSLLPVDDLLESAIWWISNNLQPEEVFSSSQLEEWAKDNDFVEKEN